MNKIIVGIQVWEDLACILVQCSMGLLDKASYDGFDDNLVGVPLDNFKDTFVNDNSEEEINFTFIENDSVTSQRHQLLYKMLGFLLLF